jgi:GMP synthase-like glutamine amidotransferase
MKNIYIVNGSVMYKDMFLRMGYQVTSDFNNADVVCFTGGEDVTPSLYGHARHHTSNCNINRDTYESDVFNLCIAKDIPMVGICRGAQFLNVMSGGEMYQDVSKHTRDHSITDLETGEVVMVSSTHHQMMKPSSKAVLVASSTLGGYREVYDGQIFKRELSEQDNEVVYYPETNCLCFQPHPEFNIPHFSGMHSYFKSLLERFLVKECADNLLGCSC